MKTKEIRQLFMRLGTPASEMQGVKRGKNLQPFFTTSRTGKGSSLSLSRDIIKVQGQK